MCVTDDDEKAKRDAGKWWKPWVSQPGGERSHIVTDSSHSSDVFILRFTVENNCGYHLFESGSEEEEEEVVERKEEKEPPKKKSAFQVIKIHTDIPSTAS